MTLVSTPVLSFRRRDGRKDTGRTTGEGHENATGGDDREE